VLKNSFLLAEDFSEDASFSAINSDDAKWSTATMALSGTSEEEAVVKGAILLKEQMMILEVLSWQIFHFDVRWPDFRDGIRTFTSDISRDIPGHLPRTIPFPDINPTRRSVTKYVN